MKKLTTLSALALCLCWSACTENGTDTAKTTTATEKTPALAVAGLQLRTESNPEWTYENLRLYPIVADPAALARSAGLPQLKTLAEAMLTKGFRITERKQFGSEQEAWYNALTVQNKSTDTVLLMAGDVVTGGNQDRVIAFDDVVLPGTLKNIEVFCVESGRSSYYDEHASESEKRVAAFKGYYNVASPRVRKAVHVGKQDGVWQAVADVTSDNQAVSPTSAYAALETDNEQKARREAYLRFFEDKFLNLPNTVGMIAVCNGKVLGVDVFAQPDLFQRQFLALLHGYATEAAVAAKTPGPAAEKTAEQAFRQVAILADANAKSGARAGKFSLGGQWVHLFDK